LSGQTELLLSARDVHKRLGCGAAAIQVLQGVSMSLRRGELVLLVGPSGSGKTTLLSILAGLMRPSGGVVELCGARISEMSGSEVASVRRRQVGFVFQGFNLFGALTALDNVAEPLALKGVPIAQARERARSCLERVGLSSRASHAPAALSGGERQRVAIARALAGDPAIVFGDEPTAALDGRTADAVLSILREAVDADRAMLLVTHDRRLERYADRVLHLEDGCLHARGGAAA
jgi:putative ABC transport system ATP-binding protein